MFRVLILALCISVCNALCGQSAGLLEPLELAQLEELRNGILVIGLHPENQGGIVTENSADAWKTRQIAENNRSIIAAFTNFYTFSELAFIYTDQFSALESVIPSGVLLSANLTPYPPQFTAGKTLFLATITPDAIPAWTDVKCYKKDQLAWSYPKGAGSMEAIRFEKAKDNYRQKLEQILLQDSLHSNHTQNDEISPISNSEKQQIQSELVKLNDPHYVPKNAGFLYEQFLYSPSYTQAGGMLIERVNDQLIIRNSKKQYVVNFHHFQRIDWQVSAQLRFENAVKALQSKLDRRILELEHQVSRKQ